MKRRLMTVAVAAIMAVLSAFTFIGCAAATKKPSAPADTFYTGTLSQESYATANAAAEAFLANEVNGEATDATFESYEKQADMTEDEIAELNLTESELAAVDAAEKGVVNYTEGAVAQQNVYASATTNVKKIKVYVIHINNTYKYYTPSLESGDVLTKAYFDEVFDPAKYKNCTMTTDMTVVTSASAQGVTVKMTMKATSTMMSTEEKAYVKTVTSMSMLGQTQKSTVEMYIEFNGTGDDYTVYVKEDGETEWSQSYIEVEELGAVGTIENDYSYFIKTKSGFKLNSEKFDLYLQDAMKDLGSVSGIDMNSLKATADYNVYDGKLSKATAVVSAKFSADGTNGTVKATTTVKYSDFGTTVVSVDVNA